MKIREDWWNNKGGFFGMNYIQGDNSKTGYLPDKEETLEERTTREVEGIVKLLNLIENPKSIPNNKRPLILDCPSGYGRHTIELLKRDYHVQGIDINEEHIQEAKRGLDAMLREKYQELRDLPSLNLGGYFKKMDMRHITDNQDSITLRKGGLSGGLNTYDAVINMFYSFGFFESEKDNVKFMQEFYNCLKKDGQLLLHTDVSPEMIKNNTTQTNAIRDLVDENKLVILESYNPDNNRMEGSWEITNRFGEVIQPRSFYSVRIYTKEEFRDMAKYCGFRDVDFYGSFKGEKFNRKSKEMIMIAKK